MNSRQVIEGECGRSNPLVRLASHVTRDSAYQDMTNVQSTSNENSIVPQSFRMDDLMQHIQNINVAPENSWIDENTNQFNRSSASWSAATTQGPRWSILNAPLPQFENHPHHHQFASSFSQNEAHLVNNLEEYRKQQKLIEDSIKEFLELDDDLEQLEENIETEEPREEKKLIYFDGLCTEDVHKADTPNIVRGAGENFLRFFKNYKKKFQDRDFDVLQVEKEYTFRENNPYIKEVTSNYTRGKFLQLRGNFAEAVLYFEAAVQVNPNCRDAWRNLVYSLKNNGQYYDSYCAAKKCLRLDPNHFSKNIYYFLFDEQYYYQGCQVILDWLRNHPDYRDIVPPSYTMKDKSTTLVEKEQLADLQKMLIKAAQRRPIKPDYYVQVALSKLLEISLEYEKSAECMLAMAKSDIVLQIPATFQVALNFLRSNEPHIAFEAIKGLPPVASQRGEFNGLVYLYLKDYEKAGLNLVTALKYLYEQNGRDKSHLEEIKDMWTQLHLCAELMRRQDLLALVNERNFEKLCEKFNL